MADFTALAQPRWPARQIGPAEHRFDVAVADFSLSSLALQGESATTVATAPGPQVLLCVEGAAAVNGLALAGGEAVFVAAGHDVELEGSGLVFRAGVGTDNQPGQAGQIGQAGQTDQVG